MTLQQLLPIDGYCHGPLFAPLRKRRLAKRVECNESGGAEVWRKYTRARPPWAVPAECQAFWRLSRAVTLHTGVQHSVDHIVPLQHPLVCGLHCPANMRVIPLTENLRKSNNFWPDMWGRAGGARAVILRCPECRTRRCSRGLFTKHVQQTGHKLCRCGGCHYAHRPGSPLCEYNPLSALRLADRYGADEDDLIRCALSIISETPALAPKVQALLKDWKIDVL